MATEAAARSMWPWVGLALALGAFLVLCLPFRPFLGLGLPLLPVDLPPVVSQRWQPAEGCVLFRYPFGRSRHGYSLICSISRARSAPAFDFF
jgi:hypothetical protein